MTVPDVERRINIHLRSVFDRACSITRPYFVDAEGNSSGYKLELSGLRALRENFPELSLQETAILFSGVKAYFRFRARS